MKEERGKIIGLSKTLESAITTQVFGEHRVLRIELLEQEFQTEDHEVKVSQSGFTKLVRERGIKTSNEPLVVGGSAVFHRDRVLVNFALQYLYSNGSERKRLASAITQEALKELGLWFRQSDLAPLGVKTNSELFSRILAEWDSFPPATSEVEVTHIEESSRFEEVREAASAVKDTGDECQEILEELASKFTEASNAMKELEKSHEGLQSKVAELTQKLAATELENTDFRLAAKRYREQRERWNEERDRLRREREGLFQRRDELEEELKQLKEENARLEERLKTQRRTRFQSRSDQKDPSANKPKTRRTKKSQ